MTPIVSHEIRLVSRPHGILTVENFTLVETGLAIVSALNDIKLKDFRYCRR
jgi:hypothetical protein